MCAVMVSLSHKLLLIWSLSCSTLGPDTRLQHCLAVKLALTHNSDSALPAMAATGHILLPCCITDAFTYTRKSRLAHLVHQGLREAGLVNLVVPIAPVADQVDEDITLIPARRTWRVSIQPCSCLVQAAVGPSLPVQSSSKPKLLAVPMEQTAPAGTSSGLRRSGQPQAP